MELARPSRRQLRAAEREAAQESRMVDMLARLGTGFDALYRLTKGAAEAGTLSTELVVLAAPGGGATVGVFTRDFVVEYRALQIDNLGAHTMWVTAAEPQTGPPGVGPGVVQVPAGASKTVNLAGRTVTVYGTVGDYANLSAFERAQPPSYSPAAAGAVVVPLSPNTTTALNSGFIIVATGAVTQIAAPNPNRKGLVLVNTGTAATNDVWLALTATAPSVLSSVLMNSFLPHLGTLSLQVPYTGGVWGQAASANAGVVVAEFV